MSNGSDGAEGASRAPGAGSAGAAVGPAPDPLPGADRAATDGASAADRPPRKEAPPAADAAGAASLAATPGAPGRPRSRRLYIAGLAATAVLLAVATGLLAAALHSSSGTAQQRAAVLLAARQEASSLTNLDTSRGGREFSSVLAGSAGSLRQQLSQGRSAFLKALTANDVSSSGTVLDAGIVTMNSSSATVLLNVKATVRNKQTSAPEARDYHWQAGLVYSGGRWLMTSLEFM